MRLTNNFSFTDDDESISTSAFFNDHSAGEKLDQGVCLYDGRERIIYWSDAISEIAFVVPSLQQQISPNSTSKPNQISLSLV